MQSNFQCVLHGSFRKHFDEINRILELFTRAGINVLAPRLSKIKSEKDGFVILDSDQEEDPRMIEIKYLQNLKRLSENGFSYFVNPDGYIGKSASYELGIAQISNTPCYFFEKPSDHPVYLHGNSIWPPEKLVSYILKYRKLPNPKIRRNDKILHELWEGLMVPGSVVAVGGIIEYINRKKTKEEKEVLLVKTHKWKDRFSIVGGKVRRNERLEDALTREVKEETGLKAHIGNHICTFDQIKNSGYYKAGIQHIFIDKVVRVTSKRVAINDEAEAFIWIPPSIALKELDIEPNARHTLELHTQMKLAA